MLTYVTDLVFKQSHVTSVPSSPLRLDSTRMMERWYNPATGRPLGNADNVDRMRRRAGSSDGFLPEDLGRLAMAQPMLLELAHNAGCAIE